MGNKAEGLPSEKNWNEFWGTKAKAESTRKIWSKIRMMKLLDTITRPGMVVLDAGSGSGFFSNYFIDKGCDVYSLDYSDNALSLTKDATGNKSKAYLNEDLLSESFGEKYSGVFDLIFSDGLFEHFSPEDQVKIMNNFKNAKKEDGIIVTFVPKKYSWWQVVRPLFMPGIKEKPFTMKKLLELHGGLECIRKGGLNVLPIFFSPDRTLGSRLGVIIYVFAR